jgi:hypothetical protein
MVKTILRQCEFGKKKERKKEGGSIDKVGLEHGPTARAAATALSDNSNEGSNRPPGCGVVGDLTDNGNVGDNGDNGGDDGDNDPDGDVALLPLLLLPLLLSSDNDAAADDDDGDAFGDVTLTDFLFPFGDVPLLLLLVLDDDDERLLSVSDDGVVVEVLIVVAPFFLDILLLGWCCEL